jgi:broad specificity phosphatase PhoE
VIPRRIILIRHARSALVQRGWISAQGFREWLAEYERTGIESSARPDESLATLVAGASVLITSDASRAQATAALLAPDRTPEVSSLVRELHLDAPELGGLRLPMMAWAVIVGLHTWRRTRRGEFPSDAERERLRDAAADLMARSEQADVIAVVTHAAFRHHLAQHLRAAGWEDDPGRRAVRPMSAWGFSKV